MRLCLSVGILVWHSIIITSDPHFGKEFIEGNFRFIILFMLPMFFCLSGFLVTGSIIKSRSLSIFIFHRIMRIAPALWVEVVLSAFILGPLLTKVSLHDYFYSKKFISYMGNIVGRVRFILPGVFDGNPGGNTVNLSLWTIPFELYCYIGITILIATGAIYKRSTILSFVISLTIIKAIAPFWVPHDSTLAGQLLEHPGNPFSGFILVCSFLVGATAYLWRDRIPLNFGIFCASIFVFIAITAAHLAVFMVPWLICYITIYIGMINFGKIPFFSRGDYSYGIYLYAFPLQQTICYILPAHRNFYVNLMFSLPLTIAMAWLSWNAVEKPILGLRKRFRVDRWFEMNKSIRAG